MKNAIKEYFILKLESLFAYFSYRRSLFLGKTYLGPYMAAKQGGDARHYFMQKVIENDLRVIPCEKFRILEIGSWVGGSAITWAEAIKKSNTKGEVYCLDPWVDYKNTHRVMSEALKKNKVYELFKHNINASGYSDMIFVLRGSSDKILPLLRHEQFDLIFIDGDHAYEAVSNDIRNAAPLIKDGGIICGDDLELQYFEIDSKNARENQDKDWLFDPTANQYFHPGVCLAVGEFFMKEVSSWRGFWAMRKKANEWEKINLDIDMKNIKIPLHLKSENY